MNDVDSGVVIEVTAAVVGPAAAELASGLILYRDALGAGSHIVHHVTPEGTEDFVSFGDRPEHEELRYDVALGARVSGLRLVARTLEFLDVDGVPRLRMAPPYLVDASGRRHELAVELERCAVDTDPRHPAGRPVIAPGSPTCGVRLSWMQQNVRYPILVDPVWSATGSMVTGRYSNTATLLSSGKVLVAGGSKAGVQLKAAELYDPNSGTWASTADMLEARVEPTANALPNGKVLVAGGSNFGNPLATTEIYDPATGAFSAALPMATPRQFHTATSLSSGKILVAGGRSTDVYCPGVTCATAELYNPVTATWSSAPSMPFTKESHTATLLQDGRVLVVGGASWGVCGNGTSYSAPSIAVRIYDPMTDAWTSAPSLPGNTGRTLHTSALLPNGQVLVAGGNTGSCNCNVIPPCSVAAVKTALMFDPINPGWTSTGDMFKARLRHTSTALATGDYVLVTGGDQASIGVEVYSIQQGVWLSLPPLISEHYQHTATLLPDGNVLVAGGGIPDNAFAELYDGQLASGGPCSNTAQCAQGTCVDGFCCDTPCNGVCVACSAAKKGQGADGVCGPILAGTDPQNECAILGTGVCKTSGFCDGNGACASQSGNACGAGSCAGPTTQVNAPTCDAVGNCVANGTSPCDPYVCQGSACLVACASDAQCAPGYVCAGGVCKQPGPNGIPCSLGKECTSQFCADGVCCDSPCNGACESCLAKDKASGSDGLCGPVKASTDPADECPADEANTCGADGACDGIGACRTFALEGTKCGDTVCMGSAVLVNQCDGAGKCAVSGTECSPFACVAGACAQACAGDVDCAEGFVCSPSQQCKQSVATCDGDHTTTGANGVEVDCAPFKCDSDGSCKESCASVDDCVPPNVCDESFKCGPGHSDEEPGNPSSGCGCRTGGDPAFGGGGAAMLLLAIAAVVRRRRIFQPPNA
ncbi:MAG: kelch repeat-containing protein [Polyangiaceae bacterium]